MTSVDGFVFMNAAGIALQSITNSDLNLIEMLSSGGLVTVVLVVGWILIRRSDEREVAIRKTLEDELRDERTAHQATREQLMQLLQDTSQRRMDD